MLHLFFGLVCIVTLSPQAIAFQSEPSSSEEIKAARKALQSGNVKDRQTAAQKLGKLKAVEAIPDLVKALEDKDRDVGWYAQQALITFGEKCVPALKKMLASASSKASVSALEVLLDLGPKSKEAVPELIKALEHKSVAVRIRAAATLAKIGPPAKRAVPALIKLSADMGNLGGGAFLGIPICVSESAIVAIKKLDPASLDEAARLALPVLIRSLEKGDAGTKRAAVYALKELGMQGREAIPALKAFLPEARDVTRRMCINALLAMGKGGEQVILDVVQNPKTDLETRNDVLQSLGWEKKTAGQVKIMIALLQDREIKVRVEAVHEIEQFGRIGEMAIPVLVKLLEDEELFRARSKWASGASQTNGPVATALSRFGKAAVPALRKVANDENVLKRWQATYALSLMRRQAKEAIPELKKNLSAKPAIVVVESACALLHCDVEVDKTMTILKLGLQHPASAVKWVTLDCVGRLRCKGKDLIPTVVEQLKNKEVQEKAFKTLGRLGPWAESAVPDIVDLMKNDKSKRSSCLFLLQSIGPGAKASVPVLIELVENGDKTSRGSAISALGAIGPDAKAAVPALVNVLKAGGESAHGAILALESFGPEAKPAVPQLITFLKSKSPFERTAAARTLGKIGPEAKAAVEALKPLLEEETKMVQVWSVYALATITGDTQKYVPVLMSLHRDTGFRGVASSGAPEALIALSDLGPKAKSAFPLFVEVLTASRYSYYGAKALARFETETEKVLPLLLKMLKSEEAEHRRAGAHALKKMGSRAKSAIEPLKKLLEDNNPRVVDAAEDALLAIESDLKSKK